MNRIIILVVVVALLFPQQSKAGQANETAQQHYADSTPVSAISDQSSSQHATSAGEKYGPNYNQPTTNSESPPVLFQEIIGVFLVLFTFGLWLTSIWQWRAIKEQAEIASKAQRAFVSVTGSDPDGFREGGAPTIALVIRNEGATPAYGVKCWRIIGEAYAPFRNPMDFRAAEFGPAFTLTPRAEIILNPAMTKTVTHRDVLQIRQALTQRIYIWGRIEYADAFGEPHFLDFCYYIRAANAGLSIYPTEERNNAD